MTHLFGTYIPENKGLYISLTNIYGLGTKQVINICKSIGINPKVSISQLTKKQEYTTGKLIMKIASLIRLSLNLV